MDQLATIWTGIEILVCFLIVTLMFFIKLTSQKVATFGFLLLILTAILSALKKDFFAGKVAEFILLLFILSLAQEVVQYLRKK